MNNILIIGTGIAGPWSALSAIRQLNLQGQRDAQVTLLAPQAELQQPQAQRNLCLVQGTTSHVDAADRRVHYRTQTGTRCSLPYDRLIAAQLWPYAPCS
jgi:NADH dehydrogenase